MLAQTFLDVMDHARQIATMLMTGGVALVPAEGVYGLVADSRRGDAMARIRQLKGRDAAKPMLGLVRLWREAEPWVKEVPSWAYRLEKSEWPVTLLLKAAPLAPEALVGPEGFLGLRVPADAFGRALVAASGAAVVSTSANLSGEPPARRINDVPVALRQRLDAVVEGGTLSGAPSTIVRWEGGVAEVIREGAVDRDTLARLMAG